MIFLAVDPEKGNTTRKFPDWTIEDMKELAQQLNKLPGNQQDEMIEAFNGTLGISW